MRWAPGNLKAVMIAQCLAVFVLGCSERADRLAPSPLEPVPPPSPNVPNPSRPNVPNIAGVFELTAQITSFDPIWGDLQGYRFEAALTLQEQSDPTLIGGSYADLRLIGPSGEGTYGTAAGIVTGAINNRGQLLIELEGNGGRIGLTLIVATLDRSSIAGTFGCCGHISGNFSAEGK